MDYKIRVKVCFSIREEKKIWFLIPNRIETISQLKQLIKTKHEEELRNGESKQWTTIFILIDFSIK